MALMVLKVVVVKKVMVVLKVCIVLVVPKVCQRFPALAAPPLKYPTCLQLGVGLQILNTIKHV